MLKNIGLLLPIQQQGPWLNKSVGIHCDSDFDDRKDGGGPANLVDIAIIVVENNA